MSKPTRCAGFDEHGKAFPCPNTPGTRWGPMWCQECDERRMVRLDGQFKALLGGLEDTE